MLVTLTYLVFAEREREVPGIQQRMEHRQSTYEHQELHQHEDGCKVLWQFLAKKKGHDKENTELFKSAFFTCGSHLQQGLNLTLNDSAFLDFVRRTLEEFVDAAAPADTTDTVWFMGMIREVIAKFVPSASLQSMPKDQVGETNENSFIDKTWRNLEKLRGVGKKIQRGFNVIKTKIRTMM